MGDWWERYNGDIVYVVDMDTYELMYVHDEFNKIQMPDMSGTGPKKCYEVLQGFASPCAMCTNETLREKGSCEWNHFNHRIQRAFHLNDEMVQRDGRNFRVEMATAISEEDDKGRLFIGLDPSTILVNETLRMALEESNPNRSIQCALEHMGQALGAKRAYVFEMDGPSFINNTYEWCAYGVKPEMDALQHVPVETCAMWFEEFSHGRYVVVPDVEAIKETEPLTHEYLATHDITSRVMTPLYNDTEICGFFGFDNPPGDRMKDILPIMKTMGHVIDSLIQRRNLMKRLNELSFVDQMTRLGNRHALIDQFENLDKSKSVGVAFCDACDLKHVNDVYGHAAGDELLLNASKCLAEVFTGAALYRIGGDEFLVLDSGIGESEFRVKCNLLRARSIAAEAPLAIGSIWEPTVEESLDRLLELTDKRMYDDKRDYYGAASSLRYFMPSEDCVHVDYTLVEYSVRHIDAALAQGEIQVHFQPGVRSITGTLRCFEALSRWTSPKHGKISPAVFIPALEHSKQAYKLDLFVVREVCKRLRAEIDAGRPVVPVSVNVSRSDFSSCDIFSEIDAIRMRDNLPSALLQIELTESIMNDDDSLIKDTLQSFRENGYLVAMDDFGSGYSSLNQFADLGFDEVKLDMVFMRNFDESSRIVVRNMVKMSKQVGVKTVAEGVETKEQFDFLKSIGCDFVQGFYFSQPLPYDEAVAECVRQGLRFENAEEQGYLDNISDVDLITDRTLAIMEYADSTFNYLHVNDAYLDVLYRGGKSDINQIYHNLNSPSSALAAQFRRFANELAEEDGERELLYVADGEYIKATVSKVTSFGDRSVFKAEVVNVGDLSPSTDVNKLDSVYRMLYFMFDGVYTVDMTNGAVTPVSHDLKLKTKGMVEETTVVDAKKKSLARLMHPDDYEEYLRWIEYDAVRERLESSEGGVTTGYFRGMSREGEFIWKAHRLFAMPDGSRGSIIYTVMDIPHADEVIATFRERPLDS